MDLIDIYMTFHSKTSEYTFFSSAHGIFSRIDHILHHKSSLSKFKKVGKEDLNIIKGIYNKPTTNIILNGEKLKIGRASCRERV